MSKEHDVEPDAWRWKRYILGKTACEEVVTKLAPEKIAGSWVESGRVESKEEIDLVPDTKEPLFSAETIVEGLDSKATIERNGHEFVRADKLKEVFSGQ
jgi:hypothetical protein